MRAIVVVVTGSYAELTETSIAFGRSQTPAHDGIGGGEGNIFDVLVGAAQTPDLIGDRMADHIGRCEEGGDSC